METKKIAMALGMVMVLSLAMPMALAVYDADNPYTVTMNFIVGSESTFTVSLAGVETTIDFNPTTRNSKEVEPDSQVAGTSTPMLEITNTGNVNLDFKHFLNATIPEVAVSYNTANTVDWAKTLTDGVTTIATSVAADGTANVYFWANFTGADAGTTPLTYQINSSISA